MRDYEAAMSYFADIREELKEAKYKEMFKRTEEKIAMLMRKNKS